MQMITGHWIAPVDDGTDRREINHSAWTKALYDDLRGFNRAIMAAHFRLESGEAVRTQYHLFALSENAIKAELCEVCQGTGLIEHHACNRCNRSGLRAEREMANRP